MLKANEAARWILTALGAGESYGFQINQTIERARESKLWISTLYTTLARLERDGLVESRWGDETPAELVERHGARRRYYRLTPAGEHRLKELLG